MGMRMAYAYGSLAAPGPPRRSALWCGCVAARRAARPREPRAPLRRPPRASPSGDGTTIIAQEPGPVQNAYRVGRDETETEGKSDDGPGGRTKILRYRLGVGTASC